MKHPTQQELVAFATGELDEASSAQIARHVAACPECKETLQAFETDHDDPLDRRRMRQSSDLHATELEHHGSDGGRHRAGERSRAASPPRGAAPPGGGSAEFGSIRDYQLLEQVGQGGMGTVYRAHHTTLDRIVAIKLLPAKCLDDPVAIARFQREWKAVARLNHPNIVQAYDAGECDSNYFLVLEYVVGLDLAQLAGRCGPLTVADACELIRQAAIGLEHAHEHGLVHRDIKPANLMLATVPPGGVGGTSWQPCVKILDLGLARLFAGDGPDLTVTEQVMGTVDFMAPEQARNSHRVDVRADIYSLGASLHKLLCGRAPFEDPRYATMVSKLMAIANEPVPSIKERRGDLPDDLVRVIDCMTASSADDRWATPREVANALAPFCREADLGRLAERAARSAPASNPSVHSTSSWLEQGGSETTSRDISAPPQIVAGEVAPRSRSSKRVGNGESRIRPRAWAICGAAAAAVLAAVLAITSQFGTLEIETVDDAVRVVVSRGGKQVEVIDLTNDKSVRLWPGHYGLAIDGRDDVVFENGTFQLKRRGTQVARIVWKRAATQPANAAAPIPIELSGDGWKFISGVSYDAFQTWLEAIRSESFRVTHLHGHFHLGQPQFTGIAVWAPYVPSWQVRRDRGLAKIQEGTEEMSENGYFCNGYCGLSDGIVPETLSLWEKRPGPINVWTHLTDEDYRDMFFENREELEVPREVSSYQFEDAVRYSVRFGPRQGNMYSSHLLSFDLLLKRISEKGARDGLRPISFMAHQVGTETMFGITMRDNGDEPRWQFHRYESREAFQQAAGPLVTEGYRPDLFVPFSAGNQCHYLVSWVQEPPRAREVVRTGDVHAKLADLDAVVRQFMLERGVPAGAVAVVKDGQLVASGGYGHIDRKRTVATLTQTPFRLAEMSQLFTRAAVMKLVADKKLSLETRILPLLNIENEFDPGWSEMTVELLMNQQAGWDSRVVPDPVFNAHEIAELDGFSLPITTEELLRYMVTQPLQFRPGTATGDSHFAYVVLGQVVEQASGKPYATYLRDEFFAPLELSSIVPARTLAASRESGEPYYADPYFGRNAIDPARETFVPEPDGAFALEAAAGSIGWIGSAEDVAKFLSHYNLDGNPIVTHRTAASIGNIPGTFSFAGTTSDGLVLVALFNQSRDETGLSYYVLPRLMGAALERAGATAPSSGEEN